MHGRKSKFWTSRSIRKNIFITEVSLINTYENEINKIVLISEDNDSIFNGKNKSYIVCNSKCAGDREN